MTVLPPEKHSQDVGDGTQCWGGEPVFEEGHNILRHQSSEVSTGDELITKVRKPYTITKQRERWTEEEHQKFLEALKLYGRAWRRIEEHVGTKTAVQIRSHAQKFFSKLEREQVAGGVLAGTAQDIDIPPPRPKRKPSHPYPRKAGCLITSSSDSPMSSPSVLRSASPGFVVRPSIGEGGMKPSGSIEIGKALERSPSELKLFGQTVVVPTAHRAAPAVVNGSEVIELTPDAPGDSIMKTASDMCMMAAENDTGQSSTKKEADQGKRESASIQQAHVPGMELADVDYSKFWKSLPSPDAGHPALGLGAFPFWQQTGYTGPTPATLWPNLSPAAINEITTCVIRTILNGSPLEATDNPHAALAAATIAAASAWWALHGSAAPGFLSPGVPVPAGVANSTQKGESTSMGNVVPQNDGDTTTKSNYKRMSSGSFDALDGGKRRVRSRSYMGTNDQLEGQDEVCRPPSSSGSDDVNEHTEITEQLNEGENSGPSSNSSRCQAAMKSDESSSDKDRTEDMRGDVLDMLQKRPSEESVTGEAPKAVKGPSLQSHHHGHRFRRGSGQKASRSSGSDADQRKEVSHEGRMAFQALFSHDKLPQTFSLPCNEQQRRVVQHNNNNKNDGDDKESKNMGISPVESVASQSSPDDNCNNNIDNDDKQSSQDSKLRALTSWRRSGFVPYRRVTEEGGNPTARSSSTSDVVKASCCGLEDHNHLINSATWHLMEEEVKQS